MRVRRWLTPVGALLAWVFSAGAIHASSGAPGALPPPAKEAGVAGLLGLEHSPFHLDDPVGPEARCRHAGASDLYERENRIPGWEIGQYNCDDRVVFTLERAIGAPGDGVRLRIVDALVVPGASYSAAAGKARVNWAISGDGVCGRGNQPQSSVLVALRWSARDRVTARNGILQAWHFNTQRGRIEHTSTRGLACVNPSP